MKRKTKTGDHRKWVLMAVPVMVMIVLSVIVTEVVTESAERNALEHMKTVADSRANMVEMYAESAEDMLEVYSDTPEIINALKHPDEQEYIDDAQRCTSELSEKLGNLEGIYVSMWDTRVLAHTNPSAYGLVFKTGDQLTSLQEGLISCGDSVMFDPGIQTSPVSNEKVVAMYRGVFDEDGNPLGFVGLGFYASGMIDKLNAFEYSGYENSGYFIVGVDDKTYISENDSEHTAGFYENERIMNLCEKYSQQSDEDSMEVFSYKSEDDSKNYVAVGVYLAKFRWLLIFNDTEQEALSLSATMKKYLLGFFALAAVVFILAAVEIKKSSARTKKEREAKMRRYSEEMERILYGLPESSGVVTVNLSDDTVITYHGHRSDDVKNFIASENSPGAVEICRSLCLYGVTDEAQRERISDILNIENLREKFENDETELLYTYRLKTEEGEVEVRNLTVKMLVNSSTENLEAVIQSTDVSDDYYKNVVGQYLATKQYTFTTVIFINSGKGRSLANNSNMGNENKFYDYDAFRKDIYDNLIDSGERDEFFEKISAETIREKLEHNPVYKVYAHAICENNQKKYLKYEFHYIDEIRETVLLCVSDVTGVWEFDTLTGLCNYKGFISLASHILEGSGGNDEYSVIVTNIKWFKVINKIFGTSRCDEFLKDYSEMLRTSSLHPLVTGRFPSSDHFILLVRKSDITEEELIRISRQHIQTDEREADVLVTCGVYHISDRTLSVTTMVEHAIMAFKSVKDIYTSPYAVFSDEEEEKYLSGKMVVSEFEKALREKEFQPYYQPIYDAQTGKVVSAEALVRWKKDGNLIPPNMFIPALEENGSVSRVDKYISERVTDLLKRRKTEGKLIVPVSVNLSAMDFYASETIDGVMKDIDTMREHGIDPRYEITETAWADAADNKSEIIENMREKGAKILIDDFGSGYSSFSTVRDYNFDILKIDMGFIKKLGKNPKVDGIVTSIIDMAHSIGLKVVAEGVEFREHLDFLKENNCDYIQGYYYSHPLPEEEFENLLDEQK